MYVTQFAAMVVACLQPVPCTIPISNHLLPVALLVLTLTQRIDLCKEKGFIGIQPGDTDLHTQKTGFDFTPQDIRTYLAWLSAQGKAAGMGVGLTNTLTLIDTIVAEQFDW
jgi:hypothetical protein